MKRRNYRQSGFALLEVLIAFVIAAMALGLLFQAASSSGNAAKQAGNYEEAVSRAKSHMVALGRDSDLTAGQTEGDDGGPYRWRITVKPSATAQLPADAPPAQSRLTLYDVEVAILWTDGGRPREVVLHSQRLAPLQADASG